MDIELKRWVTLGLTTAVMGTILIACSGGAAGEIGDEETTHIKANDHGEAGHQNAGAGGEGEGEGGEGESGEAGHSMETLPIEHRLAFMSGHVQAGLALYRAGEPEMGAPHLLHPVSETHEAERVGLDTLGFTPDVFEAVSKALEDGRPASEIEPQLIAAEANLKDMAATAGGDTVGIIRFLMDTIVEEYTVAITDGQVSDPGEYQDAFGFAVVAIGHADKLAEPYKSATKKQLEALIAFWPEAPIPPENPTPIAQIVAKTSAVRLALPNE